MIHFENFGNANCPDNKVSSNDLCSDMKSNDVFFLRLVFLLYLRSGHVVKFHQIILLMKA